MKTIEQKAKAYDEVLEKAKKELDACGSQDCDAARQIFRLFPELKESEDERIRKELIAEVKEQIDCIPAPDCRDKEDEKALKQLNKWLSWLEKQGDKDKPTYSTYSKDVQLTQEEYDKRRVSDEATIKEVEAYNRGLEDAQRYFEKQGEQKPTEDSCKNSDDITSEEKDRTEYKKGFECGKQRVLKYPEDFGLCKKTLTTWSEEDEDMFKSIIATCELAEQDRDSSPAKHLLEMQTNWLNSIKDRVQPQPKQVWSEEDNQYLYGLIGLIEQSKAELPITLKGKAADNCINWLKSLRPQNTWKPSDEQMDALDFAADCIVPDEFCYKKKYLKSLLTDLKQL